MLGIESEDLLELGCGDRQRIRRAGMCPWRGQVGLGGLIAKPVGARLGDDGQSQVGAGVKLIRLDLLGFHQRVARLSREAWIEVKIQGPL